MPALIFDELFHPRDDPPETVEIFGAGAARGQPRSLGLEGPANGKQIVQPRLAPLADPVAVAALVNDEAIEGQPPQGADDRTVAGPFGQGDGLLAEVRAGGEVTVEDLTTKRLVDPRRLPSAAAGDDDSSP